MAKKNGSIRLRKRWIQDSATGKLVEADQWIEPELVAPLVMPDIKPYQSMCDGSEITSRSKHREHLRRHNVIEVGNELDNAKRKELKSPPGLKQRLIDIARDKLRYT